MPAAADYTAQLQALLPPGSAWPRDPAATLSLFLQAIADGMARLDARALVLLDEADPRTTLELLPDWERVAGLPDPCSGQADTVAARRARLVAILTTLGGQSRQHFIDVAAALGFTITIAEFRPSAVEILLPLPRNKLIWSEDLSNAAWVKTGCAITHGQADPFGGTRADLLTEDGSSGSHGYQQFNMPIVAGSPCLYCAYVAPGTCSTVELFFGNATFWPGGLNPGIDIDLAAGTITRTLGTLLAYGITPIAGGYFRVWIAAMPNTTSTSYAAIFLRNGGINYVGTGRTVFVFGQQWVDGIVLPDYVPTLSVPETTDNFAAEDGVNEDAWAFSWQVNSPLNTITELQAEIGGAEEPINSWGNQILECVINRQSPAHTAPIFAYS